MIGVALSPLLIFCGVLVIIGNLLRIRSSSWLGVWLGIEINLFGFLIIINPEGCCVAQRGVKYFVTQRIGSILLLFGFFLVFRLFNRVGAVVIIIGLLIKTGIFPFHNWVPDVVIVSSWLIGCLILTWQKLAPFSFFSFFPGSWFLITRLVFMSLVGCLGGLNQNSVRGIAVYSSFVHNSWIILSLLYSFRVFFVYYLIYRLRVMVFFFRCWTLRKSRMMRYSIRWIGMLRLLILSGVPPFIGFFIKLIVVLRCPIILLIICLLRSVVRLKFYISFFYRIILNRREKRIYCVKSGVLFLAFSLANFIIGRISIRYFIW